MSVRVCTEGSDRAFEEIQSWPVAMAIGYFTIAYMGRSPFFTLVFAYAFESFEFFVLRLNQALTREHKSKFAQWLIDSGPLSWIVPASSDAKLRACVESPVTSLIYDPIVFFSAVLLWHWGVEWLIGIKYDETKAYAGRLARHFVLWCPFIFTMIFSSRTILAPTREDSLNAESRRGLDPDLGLLWAVCINISVAFLIPMRTLSRFGMRSRYTWDAMQSYVVYVLFVSTMGVVGVLGGPFLDIRSSWMRIVGTMSMLWLSCILVGAVRFGIFCDHKMLSAVRRFWHSKEPGLV